LTDNGAIWTLALSHPTRGNASLTLAKGMSASGGSLRIDATTTPLRDDVQGISVSSERPVWADAGAIFDDGFEASTR
jgi:hypothetical protein